LHGRTIIKVERSRLSIFISKRADDEFDAAFGLACTVRCLGRYAEAARHFERLLSRYLARSEIIPFYALCAINSQDTVLASRLLMERVITQPPTQAIAAYQSTLAGYWQDPSYATKREGY